MSCQIIDFREASSSPLNPLSSRLRRYLVDQIEAATKNPTVKCLVLTGGPYHFSAGADLTEFSTLPSVMASSESGAKGTGGGPTLIDVVQQIENCPKPVVAAIAGTCLGGGLEVALACHYRVCTSTAKMGLPEVHVGVIPGAGGTQRLPRLVGIAEATRMILTGASVSAPKALKLKLVDAVVTEKTNAYEALLVKAEKWATWAEVMPLRRLGQEPLREHPAVVHNILHVAELSLPQNEGSHGLRSAIEALRASSRPLEQGMKVEAEAFMETLLSRPGQARRHVFFAVRQAQKPYNNDKNNNNNNNNKNSQLDQSHPLLNKKAVVSTAVIGAGTMGGGIALVLLKAGFAVTLVDINADALQAGLVKLQQIVQTQVTRKQMKPEAAKELLTRLQTTTLLEDLSQCQLVVEAVVENLPIKRKIFATLDKITPPDAFLLSNTSTLSIDAMAAAVSPHRRARFLGWHFFSPAHVMKLVEIVVGRETSLYSILLLQALTRRIGKIGVVVGNCDGFCGNRLLRPYSAEMVMLLAEGVSTIKSIDTALLNFGMALGPFAMGDLAGNDVAYNIRKERGWVRSSPNDPRPSNRPSRYTELADVLVAKYGRSGQKVGKGWYNYDPMIGKGRTPLPAPEVDAIVKEYATRPDPDVIRPAVPTVLSAEQIIERVLYPLVNEGFKCLEEGIVQRPSDIDVVYVYGYGWPVWRGGPMNWADHEVGLPQLLQTLHRLSQQFPETDHYQPSRLLEDCVRLGTTVEEYYGRKEYRSKL